MDMSTMTWTCHICGRERPDAMILVYSAVKTLPGGVQMTQNVRYCADNGDCAVKAVTHNFMK